MHRITLQNTDFGMLLNPTIPPDSDPKNILSTPHSGLNSNSFRFHPKVMFSCTPLKRSAPSPSPAPQLQSHQPIKTRGDAPQKNLCPCTPNTHLNNPKYNWKLPLTEKPIRIIGDSNLSRITSTTNKNVQVESYPGAKLCHADRIVSSYSHPNIRKYHPTCIFWPKQ